jgi:hypothetical protein
VTSLLIDNIATLITNDPSIGRGPLGIVPDATLAFADGKGGGQVRVPRSPRGWRGVAPISP